MYVYVYMCMYRIHRYWIHTHVYIHMYTYIDVFNCSYVYNTYVLYTARSVEDETRNGDRNAKRNPHQNQETTVLWLFSNFHVKRDLEQ